MSEVKQVKFSSNGAYIMLGTSENSIVLIDAYEGKLVSIINFNFCHDTNPSNTKINFNIASEVCKQL